MHLRASPRLWATDSDLRGPRRPNHRAPVGTSLILPLLQPPTSQGERGWLTCPRGGVGGSSELLLLTATREQRAHPARGKAASVGGEGLGEPPGLWVGTAGCRPL